MRLVMNSSLTLILEWLWNFCLIYYCPSMAEMGRWPQIPFSLSSLVKNKHFYVRHQSAQLNNSIYPEAGIVMWLSGQGDRRKCWMGPREGNPLAGGHCVPFFPLLPSSSHSHHGLQGPLRVKAKGSVSDCEARTEKQAYRLQQHHGDAIPSPEGWHLNLCYMKHQTLMLLSLCIYM